MDGTDWSLTRREDESVGTIDENVTEVVEIALFPCKTSSCDTTYVIMPEAGNA